MDNNRILLIDDDEVARDLVGRILGKKYTVDLVQDAHEGLLKAASQKYDLILLDIGLPGNTDGVEVYKELRKLKGYESTPVVAFTAFAMASEKEQFKRVGFDDYISKPFDRQSLIDVVERNLDLKK